MNDLIPDDDAQDGASASDGSTRTPAAVAATEQPVELRVRLLDDERTPDGLVCMGTFRGERLVARCVLQPDTWAEVQRRGMFTEPVPVVLVAREAPPGLQCQLFAMLPLSDDADDSVDEEPWAAGVPGAGYEAAAEPDDASDAAEGDEEVQVLAFPLGSIVRYERDRVHHESLPLEAADVLRKIIEGKATELVDRALADLLGR